jgi:hypothetical protein
MALKRVSFLRQVHLFFDDRLLVVPFYFSSQTIYGANFRVLNP